MKGIVLSLSKKPAIKTIRLPGSGSLIKNYGLILLFAALLLFGLVGGALYAHCAGERFLKSLDFLFMTNLDARLKQGDFGIFCACFASDFIFLLSTYLFGMSLWGIPFIAAAVLFKGFGTGLTAGYLSMSYSLSGVGFYLLVLLPGTFLFCVALIFFSAAAFRYSQQSFRAVFLEKPFPNAPRQTAIAFGSRFCTALIISFAACALDTVLWTCFAGTFKF